ncbi:uncharacterized protein VNE69_04158 [Vairimorpha necatrix]|uniref:BTB domain-containing protein n=1 Tax=Vairimorpha necatrix TaxID=6039 RepID=A0AAX4JBJ6_9MICR
MSFEKDKFLMNNSSDLNSSADSELKNLNLFSFYKKNEPALTWKEERAIDNLVVMSNITTENLYSNFSCIPSCEFINDKLQFLDCNSPVDSYIIQMYIYCGVIDDFSILMKLKNSFEDEVISTFEKNVLDTYYKRLREVGLLMADAEDLEKLFIKVRLENEKYEEN